MAGCIMEIEMCSISPMTLDEAIEHCNENVQRLIETGCDKCAAEHKQLAVWLEELKQYKIKDSSF